MKPNVFIGSSSESLDVAYALQENLEHAAEITVWTQGIFELSKFTLDSLVDALDNADFGVFVFTPTDLSLIKGQAKSTVRDNVVFELGLFVGRLGRDRNFIIFPRGQEDTLHLPTDLLGITPALYEADRQDGNIRASLGPACSKLSRAFVKLGALAEPEEPVKSATLTASTAYSAEDNQAILASWMGSRTSEQNTSVIHFTEVDRELRLAPGTAKMHLESIAGQWRYEVAIRGDQTILFKPAPLPRRAIRPVNF